MIVEVLVGLPASGKSTYCKEKTSFQILSSDGIRKELYGSEAAQGKPAEVFSVLYSRMEKALSEGKDVIVDATNLNAKERSTAISIGKRYNAKIRAVVFDTPIDVCTERNTNRERKVPEFVYKKMISRFMLPTKCEGFDEITII